MIVIDGKLIAFESARGFESSNDAANRFKSVEVEYGFITRMNNVTKKESQTHIKGVVRKLNNNKAPKTAVYEPRPIRATYTLKDGTQQIVEFEEKKKEPKAV